MLRTGSRSSRLARSLFQNALFLPPYSPHRFFDAAYRPCGGYSNLEPRLPISNRTVKRVCADDSVHSHAKVGHRHAKHRRPVPYRGRPFLLCSPRGRARACGAKCGTDPMETPEIPIQESLTSALEHHRAGRLTAAEAIYRRILAAAGDVAEVLNNLSLILQQTGRNAEAEDLLLRAIARNPAFAEAHSNLGNLLQGLGRATEAEKVLRRAVALKPRYAGALSNLGIVLHHGGQLEEAVSCFRLALVEDAASPAVLSNLALALESL